MTQTELDLLVSLNGKREVDLSARELGVYLLGQHAGLAYASIDGSCGKYTVVARLERIKQTIQKLKGNNA